MMLKLAELNSASAAQTFAAYCVSQHWPVSVVVLSTDRAELYADELVAAPVQQELALFMVDPDHPKYSSAAWAQNQPAATSGSLGLLPVWQRMRSLSGFWTQSIALLCVLVFIAQQIWPVEVYNQLKFFSPWQFQQDWLSMRWLTPALLHFGVMHLMFNLLAWWIFAGRIEVLLGTRLLLVLSIAAAAISNTAQFLLHNDQFGGLSGVAYAVMGFAWCYGWRFPAQSLRLSNADIGIALLFLMLGFADMLWVNTANWAHLGGLLVGIGFAFIQPRPSQKTLPT
jgi:GlpG protein